MAVGNTKLGQTLPVSQNPPGFNERVFYKLLDYSRRPGCLWVLFLVAFVQSAFFPVPSLLLFVTLSLGSVEKTFRFAVVCMVGSVLGGVVAYLMGYLAWEALKGFFVPHVFSQHLLTRAENIYHGNIFLALMASSFLPISYQVCAIAAGVLKVNFTSFLAASCVARAVRFLFLATLVRLFGEKARAYVQGHLRWFWWLVLLLALLSTGVSMLLRTLG